jgi:hypothetical protein
MDRSTLSWPQHWGVSDQLHAPAALPPGERAPGTQWIGGWVDPRASLDDVEKRKFLTLPGLELRPLDRPARSQSLYRLSYIGSWGRRSLYQKRISGISLGVKSGRRVGLPTLPLSASRMSENVGAWTSRNPKGLHGLYRNKCTFLHTDLLKCNDSDKIFPRKRRRAAIGRSLLDNGSVNRFSEQ